MSHNEIQSNIDLEEAEVESLLEILPPQQLIEPHIPHEASCRVLDTINQLPIGTTLWRRALEGSELSKDVIKSQQILPSLVSE